MNLVKDMAMKRTKSVDEYIENAGPGKEGLEILRGILQNTELVEEVKWGSPVYTFDGKNVIGIGCFKSYFGLWFYQGVFLSDPAQKLINASEGVTRGMRQWRFRSPEELDKDMVRAYVDEAIENQKMGKSIKPQAKPLVIPKELQESLDADTRLRSLFKAFTPGRQKEFAEYVSTAKREETRYARVEKIIPMITAGVGLNDKYR